MRGNLDSEVFRAVKRFKKKKKLKIAGMIKERRRDVRNF